MDVRSQPRPSGPAPTSPESLARLRTKAAALRAEVEAALAALDSEEEAGVVAPRERFIDRRRAS